MKKNECPNILIVDDSPDLLHAIKFTLEKNSFKVLAVISQKLLQSALDYYIPDIILLDIVLETENDGLDICKTIKTNSSLSNIPILLMSGNAEKLQNFDQYLADGTILKPFTSPELIEKIYQLLQNREVQIKNL